MRCRSALLSCLLVLFITSPLLAQSSLKTRQDYVVGDHPVGVVATDYDADGFLDLITVNQQTDGNGDIALLKGFGDGRLRKVSSIVSGSLPSALVYTDVNSDGKPDLVVADLRSQEITVHLGNGTGGFGAKLSTLIVGTPASLAVGDFNGDAKPDVAILNSAQNNVQILLGDGLGRFPTSRQTFAIAASSKQILTIDLNADAKRDLLVVSNTTNTLRILRGDGTGLFTLNTTLTTGTGPVAMVTADFNNDTRPDIAVANQAGDNVSVFLQSTSGSFGSPSTLSPGFGPRGIAVADLNKDGRIDLIVTLGKVSQEGQVALMTGNGAGGFTLLNTLFVGPAPNWAATGDFNRDGNLDLVTANNTGNTVSLVPSIGTATFLIPGRIPLPFGSFPASVVVGDFNNDSKVDVISANEQTNNISVVNGDGLCGFTSVTSANNTGITPINIVATHFNADSCPDLLTVNNGDGSFSIMLGNCAGNFAVTNGNAVGCPDPISVSVGDVNGDGRRDIGMICETAGELCTRLGTGVSSPVFGLLSLCTPSVTATPQGVAMGAYNLDADEDYAITSSPVPSGDPTDIIAIAKSDGLGGVLDIPATFPVGLSPRGVVNADLNGDGFLDLLVANSGSNSISALLGDGGGVFSFPSIDSPAGQAPTSIAVADFNLDGKLDAATTNTNANNVSLLLGDGFGHFTKAGDYGTRDLPISIGAGDCNGDGKPDLLVADNFNDTITVLVNQTAAGDPLQVTDLFGQTQTVYSWGIVAGAKYDVIRGQLRLASQGPTTNSLGPVTCLANDLTETDTANLPDTTYPPSGDAYFYLVRATVGGLAGNYTVSVPGGKPGVPSSGGCP
ncbi:MAG TPA: VCBS repeat-containing protein [Candidatus Polarisedimenticolia bacterium]|nr:VCBS repeat-containing protein [Candidatus Polarisedimenticolia bacterium]